MGGNEDGYLSCQAAQPDCIGGEVTFIANEPDLMAGVQPFQIMTPGEASSEL